MKFQTDFANHFETTMVIASSHLKGNEFFKFRSDLIDEYAMKCLNDPNGTYYPQQVDGIFRLILEYGSIERANQFCLSLLFKDRVSNSKLYATAIQDRGVKRLEKFLRTRKSLASQIVNTKKKMEQEDDVYQDALKLKDKANSLYMKEIFDEVIDEKESELDSLYRELSEHNQSMNRLLFGKESLDDNEQVCFDRFVNKYCPTNIKK